MIVDSGSHYHFSQIASGRRTLPKERFCLRLFTVNRSHCSGLIAWDWKTSQLAVRLYFNLFKFLLAITTLLTRDLFEVQILGTSTSFAFWADRWSFGAKDAVQINIRSNKVIFNARRSVKESIARVNYNRIQIRLGWEKKPHLSFSESILFRNACL